MVHDQCERRNLDIRRRRQYTAVVLHFGYWLADRGVAMDSFTTDHVESFLADHATGCSCSCIWKMRTEVEAMRRALTDTLAELRKQPLDALLAARYQRLRAYGSFKEASAK